MTILEHPILNPTSLVKITTDRGCLNPHLFVSDEGFFEAEKTTPLVNIKLCLIPKKTREV